MEPGDYINTGCTDYLPAPWTRTTTIIPGGSAAGLYVAQGD